MEIPYGYCHCGCGQKTTVLKQARKDEGYTKGEPRKYISGHNGRQGNSLDKFWTHVNVQEPDDCWEWIDLKDRNGYGRCYVSSIKRVRFAHRVSYILTHGEIPNNLFVLHKCDNPPCCNPNHLFLGAQDDNMKDCAKKGRTNGAGPQGERHGNSKLKDDDVRTIKTMLANGIKQTDIARKFNVRKSTINGIKLGKSWKHIA